VQIGPNHGLITYSVLSCYNKLAKHTLIAVGMGMWLLRLCVYRHIQPVGRGSHRRSQMSTYRGGFGAQNEKGEHQLNQKSLMSI